MSNTNDMLKALVEIRDALKNMKSRDRSSFASDEFGSASLDAARALAQHLESAKEEIKSADEYMKDFTAGAESAAKGLREAEGFTGKIKAGFSFIDKSTNNFFTRSAKKFGLDKVHKRLVNTKNATIGWTRALSRAQTKAEAINIALKGVLTLLGSIVAVIAAVTLGVVGIGAAITKSIIGALTSLASMASKTVKFIFTLPTAIANRAAQLGNELRKELVEVIGQAVENTKDLFDMASNGGSAFVRLGNIAKGSLLSFQSVNSTMTKLFGYGAAGAAKMVADVTKNIADMGLFADVFAKSTTKTGESIVFITRMTRGMAMQGDDLNYVVRESMKNGEHFFETMTRMYEASEAASTEFGINRKLLSKNFFQLRKDIINFGHLSEPTLMSVAAKATQMGVEMKDLAAVFNKFGTFEDAANSAALLSQTFGMNIDALQLIRAENPMEIVEMFRGAMHATGRSFDDLNRHEKSLMASHTGLSVEALKTVMNYRTLGKSYEDIKKIMNDQKPEERQIKAMKAIRDSVSEVQKTMDKKDFFTAFTDGLAKTLLYSTPLRKAYTNISKTMENFYESGLRVNKKDLAKIVSPFADILKEINEVFSVKSFKEIADRVIKNLGMFVEDLTMNITVNNSQAWSKASKKWENKITDVFSLESLVSGSGPFSKAASVVGKIVGYLLKAFTLAGPPIIKGLVNTFDSVLKFLTTGKFSTSLDSDKIAKFLGMTPETFNEIKKDLENKIKDLKGFLFTGYTETSNGVTRRMEGKIPQIGEKLANIFGQMIPWNTIGKGLGKVLSIAINVAMPAILDAATQFAKAAAIAIAEILGLDIKKRMNEINKDLDSKIKYLKQREKAGDVSAGIEARKLESKKSSIAFDVGGQEASRKLFEKVYSAGLKFGMGPLGLIDYMTGSNVSDTIAVGATSLGADSPEEQYRQALNRSGNATSNIDRSATMYDFRKDIAGVSRSSAGQMLGLAAGRDDKLTLDELNSYLINKQSQYTSPEDFAREVIEPLKEFFAENNKAQQNTVVMEIEGQRLGQVMIDHLGRISENHALNTGQRGFTGMNSRTNLTTNSN